MSKAISVFQGRTSGRWFWFCTLCRHFHVQRNQPEAFADAYAHVVQHHPHDKEEGR